MLRSLTGYGQPDVINASERQFIRDVFDEVRVISAIVLGVEQLHAAGADRAVPVVGQRRGPRRRGLARGGQQLSTPSARPAWTSASACATIGAALPALMLGVRRDATGSVWDDDRIQAEQE
jgi:hypothetical protein